MTMRLGNNASARHRSLGLRHAAQNPCRGLVISNKDGVYQLYAWQPESNRIDAVDRRPVRCLKRSPLSRWRLRLLSAWTSRGDEIGHYVRLPFGGGEPDDITPDLPEYASHTLSDTASGNALGLRRRG